MGYLAVIEELELEPLPEEGGWFRRTFTGAEGPDGRPTTTSIHALFTREQFSSLHRLDAEEVFFWNRGDPFDVLILKPNGERERKILGPAGPGGFEAMIRFEKGWWFGGIPSETGTLGYTLMTCVVTPGFVWEGFEIGNRDELIGSYPDYESDIRVLTRV